MLKCSWIAEGKTESDTNTYLWVEDGVKPIHVHFFANKLQKEHSQVYLVYIYVQRVSKIVSMITGTYLGHLNHIGELSKTGNGNYIVMGF